MIVVRQVSEGLVRGGGAAPDLGLDLAPVFWPEERPELLDRKRASSGPATPDPATTSIAALPRAPKR